MAICQVVLGVWLAVSPVFLLPDPDAVLGASWNAAVAGTGIAVSAVAFGLRAAPRRVAALWLVLSAWLVVSPWVLRYSGHTWMTANAVIVAVVQAANAAAVLSLTRPRVSGRRTRVGP